MPTEDLERVLSELRTPGPTAEWVSAGATAITALVAIAALWFAWQQIGEAKAARALTRTLDVARSQPYVVVYAEESPATPLAIDLVVRNFGPTAAANVKVQFDPWPQRWKADEREHASVGIPEFPILAPGQEWRTSWVWTPDYPKDELPMRHEGEVSFTGVEGTRLVTPVVLDLTVYTTRIWVEVRGMHDAAKALREINKTVQKWTEGPRGPLSVLVRDGAAKDATEAERLRKQYDAWKEREASQTALGETAKTEDSVDPLG